MQNQYRLRPLRNKVPILGKGRVRARSPLSLLPHSRLSLRRVWPRVQASPLLTPRGRGTTGLPSEVRYPFWFGNSRSDWNPGQFSWQPQAVATGSYFPTTLLGLSALMIWSRLAKYYYRCFRPERSPKRLLSRFDESKGESPPNFPLLPFLSSPFQEPRERLP